MTQKTPIDPVAAYYERQLYLNHRVMHVIDAVYRSHGHMLSVSYDGSDKDIIQVRLRSVLTVHQNCAIMLVGLPNHCFKVMSFHQEDKVKDFTCTSTVLNGARLDRFFARLQDCIITTLAKAEASHSQPELIQVGKGFVQRVKSVARVQRLDCYEITLANDKTVVYEHPEDVPMKIVPGGWLYGDGEGKLEYFAQRAPH